MTERKTETPSKGILKCTLNLLICYFYILSGITGIIGIIGKIGISGIIGIIIPDRYKSFLPPLPKLGTAADPFRFMDAHCWDFTK